VAVGVDEQPVALRPRLQPAADATGVGEQARGGRADRSSGRNTSGNSGSSVDRFSKTLPARPRTTPERPAHGPGEREQRREELRARRR
jgi:hypothetical protein